jgi:hypothetical protein
MPGVAVNASGDLVVVYSRTSPQMFPQVRYSTWLHGEGDLRPSQILRKGDGPIPANITDCLPFGKCSGLRTDTAGVAVDPFDHTAIWLAHLFANSSGGWSVAVGKVLGKQHPDLTVSAITLPTAAIHAGSQLTVGYTIRNGGDGPARQPHVKVVLISEHGVKIGLGEDTPADLGSGESKTHNFNLHLPANLRAGDYSVLVEGRLAADETEYNSENNNVRAISKLKVASP